MELWFNVYRETDGDRMSPLVFDCTSVGEISPSSPEVEARAAIEKIMQEYPGQIPTLLCSGGADSQSMIYAWMRSGHPFNIVHYYYGDNDEDTTSLLAFCANFDLPVDIRDFNVDQFINSEEYIELAIKYDCASPHILTYIKLASLHEELCLMAGNYFSKYSTGLNWTILGLDRFRQQTKANFVPFFLSSTAEFAYCFFENEFKLQRKEYSAELQNADRSSAGYKLKIKTYQCCGFPVIAQSKKMTGFEAIKEKYDSVKIDRRVKMKWSHMPSKRPFDLIYRYGLFDKIPNGLYSEKTNIIHNYFINNMLE